MDERIYRILLVAMAVLQLAILGTVTVPLLNGPAENEPSLVRIAIRVVGYLLVPVAIMGLWNWQRWGQVMLGIALAIASVADLPDGVFAMFWRLLPLLIIIGLTVEQHLSRAEAEEEAQAAEHQKPPYE
ncbi:MAG: hypothetical protein MUF06_22245 [Pirellulaceae bacterium]|jgi:lysylphosphatidylglycerol synthetase-like protein (DUF2156 family)|nr:hypothetical protein [Pirellulaceae bacterium]